MKYISITILLMMGLFNNVTASPGGAGFTQIALSYNNNVCELFFWVGEPENRKRILYRSKPEILETKEIYCSIRIPVPEFDSYFEYCALTGLGIDKNTNKGFSIDFSGGSNHPRNIYYFFWRDASYIHPIYSCKLRV